MSTEVFPTKDQAIIIDSQEGLTIKDYINSLSDIIDASEIRFISRIANNRVCIFLSSQTIADSLTNNHKVIKIKNYELKLRPLVTKAKRIIISNVCPIIPHSVIENVLTTKNIKLASKISFVKAGIPGQGFSHIMSFRRQVYIAPEDLSLLTDSTTVHYDGSTYRIFFTTDEMSCFNCHQTGHLAGQCPSHNTSNQHKTTNLGSAPMESEQFRGKSCDIPDPAINGENTGAVDIQSHNDLTKEIPTTGPSLPSKSVFPTNEAKNNEEIPTKDNIASLNNNKRCLQTDSSLPSTVSNTTETKNMEEVSKQPKKKKKKKEKNMEELITPIKHIIEDTQNNFPLTYIQFKSFLENSFSANDPILIAADYSQDISSITKMMHNLYPHLTNKTIKGRFTRIIKKINSVINTADESSTETDSSIEINTS